MKRTIETIHYFYIHFTFTLKIKFKKMKIQLINLLLRKFFIFQKFIMFQFLLIVMNMINTNFNNSFKKLTSNYFLIYLIATTNYL